MPDTIDAPPAVAETPAAPPAPTAEQLEAQRLEFQKSFFDNPRRRTPAPAPAAIAIPAEAPVEEPKPATDTPPPKPPAKPTTTDAPAAEDRKPVVVPKPKTGEDAPKPEDDDGDSEQARIDAAVAKRMAASGFEAPSGQSAAQPPPKVSSADQHTLEVAAMMERLEPGKYDGLQQKIADYWNLADARRRQWMRDNPGVAWNPDDDEHKEWTESNEPKFSKREYDHAERAVTEERIERRAVARAREEVMREMEPQLREARVEKELNRARPHIERKVNEATALVLSAVPDFEKAMDDGNGNYVLSAANEKAMQDVNPVLYAVADDEASRVLTVVTELTKMDRLGPSYFIDQNKSVQLPNGESIRPHAIIVDTLNELEQNVMAQPKKDQEFNGKSFITISERADKLAAIQNSNLSNEAKQARIDALRAAHWSIGAKEIEQRVIARSRNKLTAISKKMPAAAVKPSSNGSSKSNGTHNGQPAPKPASATAPSSGSDTVTSSDNVDTAAAVAARGRKTAETIDGLFFGRR